MNANGVQSDFTVVNVEASGVVTAALGTSPIVGIWDETSRTLNFTTMVQRPGQGDFSPEARHFTGHLFSTPFTPEPGQDIRWTLAGYFQVTDLQLLIDIGNARRSRFGWFAQITETF
jgi:hypothetical protein